MRLKSLFKSMESALRRGSPYNMKARNRIMLYSSVVIFSAILCFSIFNLYAVSWTMRKESQNLIQMKLAAVDDSLRASIRDYSRPLYSIYINDELKELIYEFDLNNISSLMSVISSLNNFSVVSLSGYTRMPALRIYIEDDVGFKYRNRFFRSASEVSEEEWYREILESRRQAVICHVEYPEDGDALLTLAGKIPYSASRMQLGAARVTIPFSAVLNKLPGNFDLSAEAIYLCDGGERVIYGCGLELGDGFDPLSCPDGKTFRLNGKKHVSYRRDMPDYGWTLVYVGAENSVARSQLDNTQSMVWFSVLLVVLSIGAMTLFSRLLTSRLIRLTQDVGNIGADEPSLRLDPSLHGDDEVGVLAAAFEGAVARINLLTERSINLEKERSAIEYQALQEQVSPHFLNNSLSAVSAMAVDIGAYDIRDALLSIAKFYRLSLSHGANLIPVSDEIELLRQYVNICRLRFGDRVSISFSVDEQALSCYTPKLVIQPFVENAIMHGLRTSGDDYRDDIVSISVKRRGDELLFVIDDNGRGMDCETLRRVLSEDGSRKRHAIQNVNRRIKLYFGERYGVLISSDPSYGTSVTIRIPAVGRDGAFSKESEENDID